MSKPSFDLGDLPRDFSSQESIEAFVDIYNRNKSSVAQHLVKLERQALFLMLVQALHHPDYNFQKVRLLEERVSDDDAESIDIEFFGDESIEEDDENYHLAFDYNDEIAGRARKFIDRMTIPPADDEKAEAFFQALQEGITRANCWKMAAQLFGKKAASQMQAHHIQTDTPDAPSQAVRPRM